MRRLALAGAVIAFLLGASGARAGDLEDLQATFERGVKALNTRDLDGFLATVHEKGLSFYSCGPTSGLEGRAACQQDWQKFFTKSNDATFTTQGFQFRVIGNTGVAWGKYTLSTKAKDGSTRSMTGKYNLVYTKVDGKWMVVLQENTPDMPVAAPGTTVSQNR